MLELLAAVLLMELELLSALLRLLDELMALELTALAALEPGVLTAELVASLELGELTASDWLELATLEGVGVLESEELLPPLLEPPPHPASTRQEIASAHGSL